MKTNLRIKNMVCNRCILVIGQELQKLGYEPESVELGQVILTASISEDEKQTIADSLKNLGFELLDDQKSKLVDEIKTAIIELIHYQDERLMIKLSDFLSERLNADYNYLSNIFSAETGSTIERFFILQKIERVKELLAYDELTLSEIAYKLHYSSVAHLSNQFKKMTGMTPSLYRQEQGGQRKPLDQIL